MSAERIRASARDLRASERARADRPPPDSGRRLATMRRGDRGQLRITWLDQDGDQRLNVRLWQLDADGAYWPVRGVGLSINAKQLPEFADAIAAALDLANGEVTDG